MNAPVEQPQLRAGYMLRLAAAEWHYDSESDELNIVLPDSAGREGDYVLVDDAFYLRCDFETGEPLTVIIPVFTAWLEKHGRTQSAARIKAVLKDANGRRTVDGIVAEMARTVVPEPLQRAARAMLATA